VDVLQTASFCHGVLMVARINQITSTELLQAREILGKLNTIGVIANGAKIRNSNAIAYIDLKRDRSLDLPQPLIEPQNSRHN
jgi:Mrp family chromosome partitioning ATPase